MSRRDDSLLMGDMLEHARLARDAARGRFRAYLDTDRVFHGACERFIEIDLPDLIATLQQPSGD